jgi:hypothetical protein
MYLGATGTYSAWRLTLIGVFDERGIFDEDNQ